MPFLFDDEIEILVRDKTRKYMDEINSLKSDLSRREEKICELQIVILEQKKNQKKAQSRIVNWTATGANDEMLKRKNVKEEADLTKLEIFATIDDEFQTTIIGNSFHISQNHSIHKEDFLNDLKSLPKSVAKYNSRGLGVEFGFSTLPGRGRSKTDCEYRNGICEPFLRTSTTHKSTQDFQANQLHRILKHMWEKLVETYPEKAQLALDKTPEKYRYTKNTGFSKITVALNNPTPFHYDKNNLKKSMTAIYIITDGECEGGEQVLEESGEAVVIKSHNGCLIIGDYTYFRHAVLPVLKGNRGVVIAYSMESISQYSSK